MAQRMNDEFAQAEANWITTFPSTRMTGRLVMFGRFCGGRLQPQIMLTSLKQDSSCRARRAIVGLGYALAKEPEDLKEYSRSLMHLSRSAHQHRAMLR
jgi:hypothetical protein